MSLPCVPSTDGEEDLEKGDVAGAEDHHSEGGEKDSVVDPAGISVSIDRSSPSAQESLVVVDETDETERL